MTVLAYDGNSMAVSLSSSASTGTVSYPIPFSDKDWTRDGLKALSMRYLGKADMNAVSVTITSGASPSIILDAEANGIDETGLPFDHIVSDVNEWHELNFDLADFGVSLTNITKITIGLDADTGMTAMAYFDNLRLCGSRQIGTYDPGNPLYVDIYPTDSGDGVVNFKDIKVMVDEWLTESVTGFWP